jgi:hypothetical protein
MSRTSALALASIIALITPPVALAQPALSASWVASDQTPPRPTPPPTAAAPPQTEARRRPDLPGQPVNVRIEVTITDQRPGEAAVQKTVGLVLADRTNGMVRSVASYRNVGEVPLNVDAEAVLLSNDRNRVLVQIGLDYRLPGVGSETGQAAPERSQAAFIQTTEVRESIRVILESGKPVVVSESADPITDRKVKVEVKATVLQ